MEAVDKSHPYRIIAELSARMSRPVESKEVTAGSIWWKFAAYNFIRNRIREADRGFFENLGTLLVAKVRSQNKTAESLPEIIQKDPENEEAGVEELSKTLIESNSDSDETVQKLYNPRKDTAGLNIKKFYSSLVYLSQHQIGFDIPNGCNQASILNRLQCAFMVDEEIHQQALDSARNMKAPEMHLKVQVIEAKELVAKDSNGKSDPFCILYLNSETTKTYNTTVKKETLSPIWEENFKLPLNDPENDVLSLEVWDFDAAETISEKISKVTMVKGLHGALKFPKELLAIVATTSNENKEFIGECQITIKDIPVLGHMKWYSLEKKDKSNRNHRGVIHLQLAIGAEYDTEVAFHEHRLLLRTLLLHEIKNERVDKYCWCGRWSAPSEAIILHHSAHRGLIARNVALAQWIEYIRMHQEHSLSFKLFKNLAIELMSPIDDSLFSHDEMKHFWDAAKELLHSCLNSIRKIRTLTVGDRTTITQLEAILGLLLTLNSLKKPHDLDLLPADMYGWLPEPCEPRTDVMQVLRETVILGCEEWYDGVLKKNKPEGYADKEILNFCVKMIQLINADLQRAIDLYDVVFIEQINYAYARTLFIHYEKSITGTCMNIVKDVCTRLKTIEAESDGTGEEFALSTTLFELYLAIRNYANRGPELCGDCLKDMEIRNYQEWFRPWVDHWLDIAVLKALRGIKIALEKDKLQPVHSKVPYSSSAVDTLCILHDFIKFWTQLAWPDVEDSHIFVSKIINIITRCSIEYADKMARKAKDTPQQIHDVKNNSSVHETEFVVSNAWCFAINNIDHICTSISFLAKDLGLQGIEESIAVIKTQQVAEICRRTLQLLIDDTINTVNNKLIKLLEVLATKMTPAMSRYLIAGAESIDTSSSSIDGLLQYLNANITTLNENLNETNFKTVLSIIWNMLLKTLHDLINSNLKKGRPPAFYANLRRILQTLIIFFNLGTDETSNIDILENIRKLLEIHGLETAALIHRYNQQRLQEQKGMEETKYGQLTVRAHFNDNLLDLQIMNARNLPPMDRNGECDPYVKIQLLPEEKFARVKQPKTQVQKATRFPLFDESFSISLSPELRETEDAMVIFEVKDKDLLRRRFMAEAFLAFSEIPETGPDRNFDSLEQIHLKLSKPTGKDSDIIRALELRKRDDRAVDFMSKLDIKINTK